MKTDPWIKYGQATISSVLCCFIYFIFGLKNLGGGGGGHVAGMTFLLCITTMILLVFINFLYLLPGRRFKLKYCLPALLTLPFILTAEDKPADLIKLSNPLVGLVYLPLLINALFGIYFFIQELTGWSVKKKM